jgi:hypothetical protein
MGKRLTSLLAEIRQSFLSVEDELISLRNGVASGRLCNVQRARDEPAARLNEQQVDFEVIGSDLRLDKLLCDAIDRFRLFTWCAMPSITGFRNSG